MCAQSSQRTSFNRQITRNAWLLGGLIILSGLYIGWLFFFDSISGLSQLDGSIGILLGLYICSRPAANVLDILMFMSADLRENIVSTNSGRLWLVLNLLTAVAAWGVIFMGVLRFVRHSS